MHGKLTKNDRTVTVVGFDNEKTIKKDVEIGMATTATDLPTGETILLKVNEALLLGNQAPTLFSTIQMRAHSVEVNDVPKIFGGKGSICKEGKEIHMELKKE